MDGNNEVQTGMGWQYRGCIAQSYPSPTRVEVLWQMFCCFWSNTLEFTSIVYSWSITDTDSVLCASEDRVILQSIRNSLGCKDCCTNTNSLTYLLTYRTEWNHQVITQVSKSWLYNKRWVKGLWWWWRSINSCFAGTLCVI